MAKKPSANDRVPAGHRSAKTGQFVTENYAKKHPSTTVQETKPGGSKPSTKK